MILRAKYIIGTLVFSLFAINSYSQNNYSVEQLINDIQRQQFDNPIRHGQDILNKIEQGFGNQYGEADYIGVVSLLSSAQKQCLNDSKKQLLVSCMPPAIMYKRRLNVVFSSL